MNNAIASCECTNNNVSNLSNNSGGKGANGNNGGGGGGSGAGGSGGSGGLAAGAVGTCYTQGGGIYINGASNNLVGCLCVNNNMDNLCSNTGGAGGSGSGNNGGAGADVGGGGASNSAAGGNGLCYTEGGGIYINGNDSSVNGVEANNNNTGNLCSNVVHGVGNGGSVGAHSGGVGTCYTVGGGIYLFNNGNSIDSCIGISNNIDNLLSNAPSAGGTPYTDGAGIYLGPASCNIVNACDLTANVTCGIQLGSPITASYNTLAENMVINCGVNGTTDCTPSTVLNGIVSYATTYTNIIENNFVKDCLVGYIAQSGTVDKFMQNTAYKNIPTQYSSTITNTVSISGISTKPGVNVTIP
jgi:hypothetical protein